jgi:glycosyltransferase involved in cell wall biosynthesis
LPPHRLNLDVWQGRRLAPLFARQQHLLDLFQQKGVDTAIPLDYPVLHALRNGFEPDLDHQDYIGVCNAGVIFFEDTAIGPDALGRARTYDVIVTGSTWNQEVARAAGIGHAIKVFQGIDPALFHPAPRRDLFPGRFVVFSGGKLEFRKGQDIVVAAFRKFRETHEDALLAFAWANQWAESVETIGEAPNTEGAPEPFDDGAAFDVPAWLVANGIPEDAFVDLGMPPNDHMPLILREADAALFPNRCEPGTNLVAMEAMACGVPAILSGNTGHRDLIDGENCYVLREQKPVAPAAGIAGTEGWGESSVDEAVAALEAIYDDRAAAATRAEAGAATLAGITWAHQIKKLLEAADDRFAS